MDASTRTERLRNRAIAIWKNNQPVTKPLQTNEKTNAVVLSQILGDQPFFYLGVSESSGPGPETHYSLDNAVCVALGELFVYASTQNLGPTRCSRMNYLWFASLAQAYNWVRSSGPIAGTKDGWNWDTHFPLGENLDVFLWMNRFMVFMMPYFIPGYNGYTLLENEAQVFGPTVNIAREVERVQGKGNWVAFQTAWLSWWLTRQADGSAVAAVAPAVADLPNGARVLEVSTSADDPNTFPQPGAWTPLKIGAKTQKYLTCTWKSVTSTGLTAGDEVAIESAAVAPYPSTVSARQAEIAEVVQTTAGLTDVEKVTAEFWAGGPFTISPPGMCIWFWKQYMQVFNIARTRGFDAFFYSGLDLSIHLFETGRIAWGLKKIYMQARPIQEIRRWYRGQTLTGYTGQPVLGELWTPYQEVDFVTPPFGDFPSGHSAFSQSFALVMTDWFGPTIPTSSPSSLTDLAFLSPAFRSAQTQPFGQFVFPRKASLIQVAQVPAQDVVLSWTTWQAMADSAGLSRKYGGIHATSAHTGSQALAQELHTRLRVRWFSP